MVLVAIDWAEGLTATEAVALEKAAVGQAGRELAMARMGAQPNQMAPPGAGVETTVLAPAHMGEAKASLAMGRASAWEKRVAASE